jgi:hypothetical protein
VKNIFYISMATLTATHIITRMSEDPYLTYTLGEP